MTSPVIPERALPDGTMAEGPTLPEVARKRAWQTAIQGLGIDVLVAVAVLILSSLDSITSKSAAITFGIALGKTVVSTVCAWVIRRYRDRSGFEPAPEDFADDLPDLPDGI